jgi:hypothetical protein
MRRLAVFPLLLAISSLGADTRTREIQYDQAQQVALTVARHDNIVVDDRTLVLNSMDTRNKSGFIPGYYSFSIIKESDSPGQPDETIRMYIVSKRTADTWELNLCRHYSFPELDKLQQAAMRETGATPAEDHDMQKDIGCGNRVQAQSEAPQ